MNTPIDDNLGTFDEETTDHFSNGESRSKDADESVNDPMEYIARCRDHRTKSVREVVLSAAAAIEGIDTVKDDKKTFAQFLRGLADVKMISKAEADKVDLSKMPTISKLRKIVQHKDIILHSTVADKMCVSYSGAYELAMLIEALPSNGDVTSQLASHLEELDGPLTRKWLTDLRQRIAPKQSRNRQR